MGKCVTSLQGLSPQSIVIDTEYLFRRTVSLFTGEAGWSTDFDVGPAFVRMKTLVQQGRSPIDPLNLVSAAIMADVDNPHNLPRRTWAWLLDQANDDNWLKACSDPFVPNAPAFCSLVHHALRYGNLTAFKAMSARWGDRCLDAEGPDLEPWLTQSVMQRDVRNALEAGIHQLREERLLRKFVNDLDLPVAPNVIRPRL